MSTPFLWDRPWHVVHVFNVPLPSLWRMCVCSLSVGKWDPLRPKYPNTQIYGWNKKKKKGSRQGHIKRVCKNSGSLKNGVDFGLWRNLGFYARTSPYLLANNFSPSVWCSRINAGRQSIQNPQWTENPNIPIFFHTMVGPDWTVPPYAMLYANSKIFVPKCMLPAVHYSTTWYYM